MNGATGLDDTDYSEFVEVDPTGRYGRYNEILGKGASKTVYRAFDEYEGIEVAWNQVKLHDFLQSPEDLERLYCEIHLLKTLKHTNIMKFYTSWVDTANRNINFVTEMFTSGTLRQYRLKHRKVNIRAVKHWCRQILKGLLYLHSRDPPIIHRDLKCDNIFVNGNQGEVKIGDLGLAAILRKSHAARCVGTPEFMAPEVYEEEYNELVDIYSFGMCILEMVTFEYPYSECTHPAQIYKKVISGKKPEALYKVKDPEVRQFVEKCLATVSLRLSAYELLNDPFLHLDNYGFDMGPIDYQREFDDINPFLRQTLYNSHLRDNSMINGYSNYLDIEPENGLNYEQLDFQKGEIDLFTSHEDEHLENVEISIRGRRREDDGIFLRLRIADKDGRFRNIYFPFDTETDTALTVATEMVAELDMTDQDVTKIAEMIDGEISTLVPEWKTRLNIEESPHFISSHLCENCASNGSFMDYISSHNLGSKNLQVLQCSINGCAAMHGRFEEITYQVDGSSEQCITEGAPVVSSQSDGLHFADIWAQHDGPEASSQGSGKVHSDEENEDLIQSKFEKDERAQNIDGNQNEGDARFSLYAANSTLSDDYENEIRQELRWLKAKYQMQLRELRDQQLGVLLKSSSFSSKSDDKEQRREHDQTSLSFVSSPSKKEIKETVNTVASGKHVAAYNSPIDAEKRRTDLANQRVQDYEAAVQKSCSPEQIMVTAKSFYAGAWLPQSLHRATSLPVDAVKF